MTHGLFVLARPRRTRPDAPHVPFAAFEVCESYQAAQARSATIERYGYETTITDASALPQVTLEKYCQQISARAARAGRKEPTPR